MNHQEYSEVSTYLKHSLINDVYGAKEPNAAGGTQFVIRCVGCGDSSDETHCHLHVRLNPPFLFFCQRCNWDGVVDQDFLKQIGIHDDFLASQVYAVNKETITSTNTLRSNKNSSALMDFMSRAVSNKGIKVNQPKVLNDLHKAKIAYLQERFNQEITPEFLERYKVVLDLKKFIKDNDIKFLNVKLEEMNTFHSSYIGFSSITGQFLTMRKFNADSEMAHRYYDYPVFKRKESAVKFYTVRHRLNILNPSLKLHITEGVMDCIGIHNYLDPRGENEVFCAACGKNYFNVVRFFLKMGFMDVDVHIYSDNDTGLGHFRKIIRKNRIISDLSLSVHVHYNTLDHDFGVERSKIALKSFKVN